MERWLKRTIEFGAGLVFTGKSNPSVIPYYPQKTEISGEEEPYFKRAAPEKHGVSSGRLLAMLRAIEKEKRANVHALLCLKDGEVICECAHPGYGVNTWHLSHSMSKTVTGMAVGMLVDDGLLQLDTPVYTFFPEVIYKDKNFDKITVRHLLTMTSGIKFAEAGSVTEQKWTEAFFASATAFVPGSDFAYNSMNSYILARIVVRVSGMGLMEFLEERLFGPLHITNKFWEKSAEGVEKGGWGLYMSAESWAKLGYMMLEGGTFEGKHILSEKWVREASSALVTTPKTIGSYDYGYQMWSSDCGDEYLFNGMLGQNVWICPKNRLVVVTLSGNNELFQNGKAQAIIERYLGIDLSNDLSESCFGGDLLDLRDAEAHFFESRHWIRPYVSKRGISYRLGLKSRRPYPKEWDELIGKYHFAKNNYGIVPLVIRGMQNNFKSSIDGIGFEREDDSIFFLYSEGGVHYRLEVGFYDFKESVIDLRGEKYIVRVMGEAMEDEDRNMLYKLEILFPEMPNTRMIKLSFGESGELIMRMSELPSEKIVDVYMAELNASNPKMGFFKDMLEKRVGMNFASAKAAETFSPRLIGARRGSGNYTEILDKEREKIRAGEKTAKIIDTLVDKLLHEEDPDDDRGFFGEIVDIIKARIPQKVKSQAKRVKRAEDGVASEARASDGEGK